jgi:hypothetical protein
MARMQNQNALRFGFAEFREAELRFGERPRKG